MILSVVVLATSPSIWTLFALKGAYDSGKTHLFTLTGAANVLRNYFLHAAVSRYQNKDLNIDQQQILTHSMSEMEKAIASLKAGEYPNFFISVRYYDKAGNYVNQTVNLKKNGGKYEMVVQNNK